MSETREQHTIDASGKRLGRVASDVAMLLMGKRRTDHARHTLAPVSVSVINCAQLVIDEKKRTQKQYERYSGYPGGRSTKTMQMVIDQKGYSELMRKAVYGMLPANRLRAPMMKQLTVSE